MRGFLLAGAAVVAAACASGGSRTASSACAAIVSDSVLNGAAVYRECGVTRPVRLIGTPARPQYTPSRSCTHATVDVVVDHRGAPVVSTAKVIRATDPGYASAIIASLSGRRYEPAMKDGVPVPQLVRIESGISVIVTPANVRPTRSMRRTC